MGKEAFAIVAGEIGGGNGLEALNVAASMGLPVVDADFMGRAFPELQVAQQACMSHTAGLAACIHTLLCSCKYPPCWN